MENKCKFSYNEIDDSLILSCNDSGENAKENFMFDDIIFYLTKNGKIIGLQIRNASVTLKESGLKDNILDNLKTIYLDYLFLRTLLQQFPV